MTIGLVETRIGPPPALPWRRWREGLFGSVGNTIITFAVVVVIALILLPLLRWAIIDATWSGTADDCARNSGACWAFIGANFSFITFGFYPPEVHWRSLAALLLLAALVGATATPRLWRRELIIAWIVVPILACLLLAGIFSSTPVSTDQWGGLTLTVLLSITAFGGAFPIAILLALGRRSQMGGVRLFCVVFIEFTRGIPLIAVLYIATLILPLMLPDGFSIDKLLRAQIGITLFISAYLAEIVRAGLQALPKGQSEAARALGLGAWQTTRLVVLPQALRAVIPAIVNLVIGLIQNTPLVAVIGIFDFLNAAKAASNNPQWLGFYNEGFAFAALVYFVICFGASRYSLWLEGRLKQAGRG